MKKILFLINEYLPEFSANSSCVANVINELKKDNIVEVITFSGQDSLLTNEIVDGVSIHRINCKMKSDYNKMYLKNSPKVNPIYFAFKKVLNKLVVSFIWPDFVITNIDSYKKKAVELINQNTYDAVISSSGDFLVQTVGVYIKRKYPSLKWIAYFNDPMPCNNFLYLKAKTTIINLKKQQEMVLKYADTILYDLELYKIYTNMFSNYKDKMIGVGIPNLIEPNVTFKDINVDRNHINIIYAGYLYRDIRNPEFLFNLISNCNLPIKLNIYGSGNCLDIINNYSQNSKGKIEYHGQVSQQEARKQIKNASILVNICNTVSEQIPCKLFEYMATGLPIINIVKNDDDPVVEYIDKYENGINIFEKTDIKQAVRQLEQFCEENAYKKIPFQKTKQIFIKNTPEYTKNIIQSLL